MSATPLLIVGLGNPGAKYANTRHNVGFDIVSEIARRWGGLVFAKKFKSELAECLHDHRKVYLMKPQTFMNLSGEAIVEAVHFYKIPPENVLLINDDVDLPAGELRLRFSGSSGGHNGLKSVIECLGSDNFPRIRVGVGRSPVMDAADWVLAKISNEDLAVYRASVGDGADAVECIVKDGMEKAMNVFNRKKDKP